MVKEKFAGFAFGRGLSGGREGMANRQTKTTSLRKLFVAAFLSSIVIGCASSGPVKVEEREHGVVTSETGTFQKEKTVQVLRCTSADTAKIAIGTVKCTAAGCTSSPRQYGGLFALLQLAGVPSFEGIGEGLQDMFTNAIQETGCLEVFDRTAQEAIQKEFALSGVTVKQDPADYLVVGTVTSINYERKGGRLGGGFIPIVGIVSRTTQTATLAMDVRLVDVKSAKVLFGKTYQAQSGKTNYGIAGLGIGGGAGFGGALSGLSGTAMEEVARDIIIRATYDIVGKVVSADFITTTTHTVK